MDHRKLFREAYRQRIDTLNRIIEEHKVDLKEEGDFDKSQQLQWAAKEDHSLFINYKKGKQTFFKNILKEPEQNK